MAFDLAAFAENCAVPAPEEFARRCEALRQLLEKVNCEVNLTRITGKTEFGIKHAADSLLLAKIRPECATERLHIADVGCGAGFPSLILALAFPQLKITAIDSTGKKIAFVRRAAQELQIANLTAVQGRAVELNRKAEYRGIFDLITARAVAPTPKLYQETGAFPKRNGIWCFYKTPQQAAEELPELQRIAGAEWRTSEVIELPEAAGARLFVTGRRK